MAQFDELQTLWQTQPAPAATAFDPVALSGAFRRFGRRQDIINIAKSVVVAVAMVHTVNSLRNRPLMLFLTVVLLCTAALCVIIEWRIQRAIARLNFSAPSIDFVRSSIARLQAQRNPFHTPAYLSLFASVLVGYNLMIFANWDRMNIERRLLLHVLATAAPAIFYAFGRWVRAGRWNAEYRPLVERLTILLETLEERAA